eukprot:scaffold235742_cov28-Tisochrysis_lutea.AAC.3
MEVGIRCHTREASGDPWVRIARGSHAQTSYGRPSLASAHLTECIVRIALADAQELLCIVRRFGILHRRHVEFAVAKVGTDTSLLGFECNAIAQSPTNTVPGVYRSRDTCWGPTGGCCCPRRAAPCCRSVICSARCFGHSLPHGSVGSDRCGARSKSLQA